MMEGTNACLWSIHIDICQKPSQYCNYPPIEINKLKKNYSLKPTGELGIIVFGLRQYP